MNYYFNSNHMNFIRICKLKNINERYINSWDVLNKINIKFAIILKTDNEHYVIIF